MKAWLWVSAGFAIGGLLAWLVGLNPGKDIVSDVVTMSLGAGAMRLAMDTP